MKSKLPIDFHYGSPYRNASTRWPWATLGDLSEFLQLLSSQRDPAVIRGMERTMDMLGKMSHRAGSGYRIVPSSLEPTLEVRHVIANPLLGSMGKELESMASSSHMRCITNLEDFGLTSPARLDETSYRAASPETPKTRPLSYNGKPGSLERQAGRKRSKTDVRRRLMNKRPSTSGHLRVSEPEISDNGDELSLATDVISMASDAEAVARLMVAAQTCVLGSSRQYALSPRASPRTGKFRKDIRRWIGSEARPTPRIADHSAFPLDAVEQDETHWIVPYSPNMAHAELEATQSSKIQPGANPIERSKDLRFITAAEEENIEEENAPQPSELDASSMVVAPSVLQHDSYESEHASKMEMLQRRRRKVDTPGLRDPDTEYPDEDEVKAIQCDIRDRIIRALSKTERRGTWYGYSLG